MKDIPRSIDSRFSIYLDRYFSIENKGYEINIETVKKELNSSKDMAELKLKSVEKQETSLQEKAKVIQTEVIVTLLHLIV
jgi:hypothetical protein